MKRTIEETKHIEKTKKLYAYHNQQAKLHSQQAKMYEQVLSLLLHNTDNALPANNGLRRIVLNSVVMGKSKSGHRGKSRKPTFETRVKALLSDGIPRGTNDIKEEIESTTGKNWTARDLSSKLLNLVRQGVLQKQESNSGSRELKNYWGLPEWFEKGKLKPEYMEKAGKKYYTI